MRPPKTSGGVSRSLALDELRADLERGGIENPGQESEWLLTHVLGIDRAGLLLAPEAPIPSGQMKVVRDLAARRSRREPLQLLLGEVPFHDVILETAPGVFIPRPETEGLVEALLAEPGRARPGRLLDWGTGTGAVAVALLRALPDWEGVAVDRSLRAVRLATRNARRNGLGERLRVIPGDFARAPADALPGAPFDLVVSNPPYIPRGSLAALPPEVRDHDPRAALDGGPDGLDAFRRLSRGLPAWLRPGGLLGLEIGADQADTVRGLFRALIPDARVLPDAAGLPRILIGTMRSEGP